MGKSIPIETVEEPHPHNRRRAPISVTHPQLTGEWYYKKNCGFGPEDFSLGSDVAPWWRCSKNTKHIWQSPIQLRASRGYGCPFCSTRRHSIEKSLGKLFPKLAKEWHPKKNKTKTPFDFAAGSSHLAWWFCSTCGNEWQASIANRTLGNGCYRCKKKVLDLRHFPYALVCFDKKANKGLDPTWLSQHFDIHWRCPKDNDHVWIQKFNKKTSGERFCPYCRFSKVCKHNNLAKLFPKLAKEWHPTLNGDLTPKMVPAKVCQRVFWLCKECGHSYESRIQDRSVRNRGCIMCWKARSSEVIKHAKAAKKKARSQKS